ncbi:flagellar biosynthetic protein FliR [Undibacterium sp. LX15W]|uniref:Flagellar biosynthetic protein FliR n=2 Tax=Undibacterium flavidum TaxID=2762297 RepID=A0ABR6YEY7_9BURK|nr:flagellar biosynthetic protein FliR [Undibacterium flavidum]
MSFAQWGNNSWLMHVFFLSIRMAGVLLFSPILFANPIPGSVRILLILCLSIAIAMGITSELAQTESYSGGLGFIVAAALKELMLGASFSIGAMIAFAAISVAGNLLDIQIGFGVAQVFDPLTQKQVPILTSAFNQLGVIFFFLVNGHHTVLRAVALSVDKFPLGASWSIESFALPVMKQIGMLFTLGFALAAPVVFCVLLVELSLGVVSRNMPQMNMFVMGVPIKIVVGIVALSIWFVAMGNVLNRVYGSIFQTWDWMLSTPQSQQSNSSVPQARLDIAPRFIAVKGAFDVG